MNAFYTYKQIRDRLLKYKKQYEEEMEKLLSTVYPRTRLITEGHIRMLDILLDDLDSESGIAWLGADFAEPPKPHRRKICEGNCEKCSIATATKEYCLKTCDSAFDAASDYNDFIKRCKKENSIEL